MVVVELLLAEAYAPVRWMILVMGGATLVAIVVAVSLRADKVVPVEVWTTPVFPEKRHLLYIFQLIFSNYRYNY